MLWYELINDMKAELVPVREGIRIEILTIVYMILEAGLALWAAIEARSALLAAFGLDSLIELFSAGIVLWRLQIEARGGNSKQVEKAEKRAAWGTVVALSFLCLYVLVTSIVGLATHSPGEDSWLGIGVSLAAVLFMPFLAFRKRALALRLHSLSLADDAAELITCAYMAGTVLLGLVFNALFHWWWVEYIAALGFLVWLGKETWEAFEEVMD